MGNTMSQTTGRSTRRSAAANTVDAAVTSTATEEKEEEEKDESSPTVSGAVVPVAAAGATTTTTTENIATTTTTVVEENYSAVAASRKRKAEQELSTTMENDETNNDKDKDNKEESSSNNSGNNNNKKMKEAESEAAAAAAAEKEEEEPSEAKTSNEPVLKGTAVDTTTATTVVAADAETSTAKNEGKEPSKNQSQAKEDDTATQSAATAANAANEKKEEEKEEPEGAKKVERPKNPYDSLKYILVRNDGKPESMIKLVGLKSLFAKQLPKMPRAYIARLVFDPRHTSLAILSENPKVQDSDDEIIGAICYRAFDDMRFAEIAFCAVNATHQVKGYGTKLMTLLKKIGAEQGIEYFITYADNYAIGYFKKQGFSKSIQMPKGRYFGLIKDYDGGTPMECYVHPSCDFTRVPEMLEAQRNFILSRIEKVANSKTIYPPPVGWNQLKDDSNSLTAAAAYNGGGGVGSSSASSSSFAAAIAGSLSSNSTTSVAALVAAAANGASGNGGGGSSAATAGSRGNQSAARAMAVPGMEQAGWTMSDLLAAMGQGKESDRQKTALKSEFLAMIRKIEEQHFAWPFREPVDTSEVPDYLEVIKEPIDLSTIDKRIRQDNHYKSKQMLYQDLMLMVNNCKLYNEPSSPYAQCASNLENYLGQLFRKEDIAGRG